MENLETKEEIEERAIIDGPSLMCSGSSQFTYNGGGSLPTGYQWSKSTNLSISSVTANPTTITVNGSGA